MFRQRKGQIPLRPPMTRVEARKPPPKAPHRSRREINAAYIESPATNMWCAQTKNPSIAIPKLRERLPVIFRLIANGIASRTIKGFAASAGRVTARACVMLGPEDFGRMQPGDVIVAGITTPAWTPLFARAAAIVTDIGGPLSHSSIVAREYGIPAVMATGVATKRIKNGQTITVDGNTGIVFSSLRPKMCCLGILICG